MQFRFRPRRCRSRAQPGPARTNTLTAAPIISIVDDDEAVRLSTAKLLRLHHFSAHAFASAEEFLDSPRAADTDCLVTDVRMPGMGGIELFRKLRSLGRMVPVIFITAFPEGNLESQAEALGAVCVLTKPFAGGDMVSWLETALRSSAGPRGG